MQKMTRMKRDSRCSQMGAGMACVVFAGAVWGGICAIACFFLLCMTVAEGFVCCRTKRRCRTSPPGISSGTFVCLRVDSLVAARSAVGLEHFLAHAERLRRHFDEFVFGDELNALLQGELLVGNEAKRIVS